MKQLSDTHEFENKLTPLLSQNISEISFINIMDSWHL